MLLEEKDRRLEVRATLMNLPFVVDRSFRA